MIFMFLNGMEDVPRCRACGEKARFNASRGQFRKSCSEECKYQCVNDYKGTNKDYTLPSGKTVKVQGYEPQALDLLLKYFNESDVIASDKKIRKEVGKICYQYNGKQKRYFPDIYIKSIQTFVEVKSSYTLMYDFPFSLAKRNAIFEAGYDFAWHVVDWDIIVDNRGWEITPEDYYENKKTR
jgi:hypothetical protein